MAAYKAGNVMVAEKSYPAGLRMPRHEHRRAYFSLVAHGSFRERVDGFERYVEGPAILYHPAGEEHDVTFGPVGSSIIALEIDFGTLDRAEACGAPVKDPAHLSNPTTHWIAAKVREEFKRADELSCIALEALTLELLVDMGRGRRVAGDKHPVSRAKHFIKQHLGSHITLEAIALAADLHPAALSRAFRRETGESITEYIRDQKVRAATEQLLRSKRPLSEISADLGFSDPSHFARTFRRITGSTPGEFRKAHRHG